MRDATRVLFFDIAGKTGVELAKVEGAVLPEGVRAGRDTRGRGRAGMP